MFAFQRVLPAASPHVIYRGWRFVTGEKEDGDENGGGGGGERDKTQQKGKEMEKQQG